MMKKKKFDCVEMKRLGAERVLERTENMTRRQQLEYWRKGTQELKALQKKLKQSKS
jgi:hypothetical protein